MGIQGFLLITSILTSVNAAMIEIERIDVFDASGAPLGTAPRPKAHREGLWHRAAIVFLFSPDGRLLVQRRQHTKDVCPGAFDVSVAEHLVSGESFESGAIRGLKEELGISGARLDPLGGVRKVCTEIRALGIKDCEFQQSFRTTFSGPIQPDWDEVLAVRFMSLDEVETAFRKDPEAYTPWFRRCAVELGLLGSSKLGSSKLGSPKLGSSKLGLSKTR